MKLIVAGGRDFSNHQLFHDSMASLWQRQLIPDRPELVSGMARGADMMAVRWWEQADAIIHKFPADWSTGKGAGFARNHDMAVFADALVAFWDQQSRGTKHMITTMARMNKPLWVFHY